MDITDLSRMWMYETHVWAPRSDVVIRLERNHVISAQGRLPASDSGGSTSEHAANQERSARCNWLSEL